MSIVTVFGEGAFGTAFAALLARNGHTVYLWCHHDDVPAQILTTRENNNYLSGVALDERIIPTHDMQEALKDSAYIFEAIPTQFLRSVLLQAKGSAHRDQTWILLSKGIEKDSLLLPSQILDEVFGYEVKKAVVSGPSFAHDIAYEHMTAVSCASPDHLILSNIEKLLSNDYFRLSLSNDVIGVQACGALKNCIALLVGMLDGAGYSESTKASMLTYALHELMHMVMVMGGNKETVFGLAGIGDVVLTAYGQKSRNREVGRRLGAGESLESILVTMNAIPESVNTLNSLQQLCTVKQLKLPILQALYPIVFENQSIELLFKFMKIF